MKITPKVSVPTTLPGHGGFSENGVVQKRSFQRHRKNNSTHHAQPQCLLLEAHRSHQQRPDRRHSSVFNVPSREAARVDRRAPNIDISWILAGSCAVEVNIYLAAVAQSSLEPQRQIDAPEQGRLCTDQVQGVCRTARRHRLAILRSPTSTTERSNHLQTSTSCNPFHAKQNRMLDRSRSPNYAFTKASLGLGIHGGTVSVWALCFNAARDNTLSY